MQGVIEGGHGLGPVEGTGTAGKESGSYLLWDPKTIQFTDIYLGIHLHRVKPS